MAILLLMAAALAQAAAPTFHKDVLPILERRCLGCHREGEIGRMPLDSYEKARPWARAIREAVISRKMPPWFADPRFGRFANDPTLSSAEIETIKAWVEGGAARGTPTKERGAVRVTRRGDVAFEPAAPFPVPAKGAVGYQYTIVPTNFSEDRWIRSARVRPSERAVVHHLVVYVREPGEEWLSGGPRGRWFTHSQPTKADILSVYTPGTPDDRWPEGMAKLVPRGSELVLQVHYTPNGRAMIDRPKIELEFAPAPPRFRVLTLQISNDRFRIPPGDPAHRAFAWGSIPNDALLISFLPHMHLRGKQFEYTLLNPEGRSETLLRVNNYDFYWQLQYRFAEPRLLRKGSRLGVEAVFDNSPANPRNPDPKAEVRFGEQSWEEMMIGFFDVAVDPKLDKREFFKK